MYQFYLSIVKFVKLIENIVYFVILIISVVYCNKNSSDICLINCYPFSKVYQARNLFQLYQFNSFE